MKTQFTHHLIAALLGVALTTHLHAQTSAFTYQGQLTDNGSPANGFFDIFTELWDAPSGGAPVGTAITNTAVAVSNGVFTVALDFGPGVFDGGDRWLEIGVATNGGGSFSTLTPRQFLASTPYAIQAANAANAASAASAVTVSGTVTASQLTGTISSNNIGAGSITTVMLASNSVGTAQLADDAVTADKVFTTPDWFLNRSLFNPTPQLDDNFGYAVSAVGVDKVLVGTPGDNTGGTSAGAAYLFSTSGNLLTTLVNPTPHNIDDFGFAVTAVGAEKVLVGEPQFGGGATSVGVAYLFGTDGVLLTTITNPTPQTGDGFGYAVAAMGTDKVLVGAPFDNTGATSAGAAYLLNTNGILLNTFTNPTPENYDRFGTALEAVGTDKVLIGAPSDSTGAYLAGAAYLFNTNGTLLTTFTNPAPDVEEHFGLIVAAVSTDAVLIAKQYDHTSGTGAGKAYLFRTDGTLLTTFTNPAPQFGDTFGRMATAVGADKVLIGAPSDYTGAALSGVAYLFSTNGALLNTFTNPTPQSIDIFGNAVAAMGTDQVLVAASQDNTGATRSGAVYLYRLSNYAPGLVSAGVAPNTVTFTEIADGAVGTAQLIPGTVFTGSFTGDGSGLVNVPGDNLGNHTATTNLNLNSHWLSGDGASQGVFVDGSGKVGIGTDSPEQKLHVLGNAEIESGSLEFTAQPGTLNYAVSTISAALAAGAGVDPTNNNIAFKVSNGTVGGTTNVMLLRGDGHVGIGTASPDRPLTIHGSGGVSELLSLQDSTGDTKWHINFNHGGLNFAETGVADDRLFLSTTNSGRVGIGTHNPSEKLHVIGNILASGTVNGSSDRNVKENFADVDPQEVLERVSAMPIQRWNYIGEDVPHIGPTAQDFHGAFQVGMDDKHISMVDADGVALAAIQGLNQKLEQKETEITELKARLEKLEQLFNEKFNGGVK